MAPVCTFKPTLVLQSALSSTENVRHAVQDGTFKGPLENILTGSGDTIKSCTVYRTNWPVLYVVGCASRYPAL